MRPAPFKRPAEAVAFGGGSAWWSLPPMVLMLSEFENILHLPPFFSNPGSGKMKGTGARNSCFSRAKEKEGGR